MATAFVAAANFHNTDDHSGTTGSANMTGANLLVLAHFWYDGFGGTGTIPTDGSADSSGNIYTQLTDSVISNIHASIWYKLAPTVGSSMTFTCAESGGGVAASLIAAGFSGISAFDLQAGGTTTSNATSTQSITPSASGELIVSVFGCRTNPDNISATPSGYTVAHQHNGDGAHSLTCGLAYLLSSSGASSPAWTVASAANLIQRLAAFTVPSVGGIGARSMIPMFGAGFRFGMGPS